MRLLGRERLERLKGSSDSAEKWLRSWVAEVLAAHWKQAADVHDQFPKAQQEGDSSFIFPVGGCECEICLLVAFPQEVAVITDLRNDR
jgi:mRNA-degrading endonuclease HigB of HigAB toxin-antitoxin module